MSATSITVNMNEVLIALGDLRGRVDAKQNILRIIGDLMHASVMRTFREEGSPAGSWPRLAASTLKKKGYSAGHKLLILTGRLRASIAYAVSGNALTIGTNLVYAAVQQYGSRDRGVGDGPQARIAGRDVKVKGHRSTRVQDFRQKGQTQVQDKNGKWRTVIARVQGAANATRFGVAEHRRFQNIPARPYLVIRPEDPARFVQGIEAYLGGGKLAFAGAA